jgi:hypothetical protein
MGDEVILETNVHLIRHFKQTDKDFEYVIWNLLRIKWLSTRLICEVVRLD